MDTIINSILENEELDQPPRESFNAFPEPKQVLGSQNSQEMDENIREILQHSLPKVQMIGIGGAGNNAATRVYKRLEEDGIKDVEILAVNTDAQDLLNTYSHKKALIGYEITKGFGAGNDPAIGEAAAIESSEELKELISGDLVFIACGLGGGTGTGAAAVIAGLAKEKGALTISISTLPFGMEGPVRAKNASKGLKRLYEASDTVVVVPNERLLKIASDLTIVQGFRIADEVLVRAVTAISELITKPQAVNLDFADVRRTLNQGGVALISLGESKSQNNRVEEAVQDALSNPLLEDLDLTTARKALICVGGGEDLSLHDAEAAVQLIASHVDPEAEIIWGASINKGKEYEGVLRVITILSDIESSFTDESFSYQIREDIQDFMKGIPEALPTNYHSGSLTSFDKTNTPKKKKRFLFR